jgi:hypothetical protein
VKTFRRRFINVLGIMAATFLWLPSAAAREDVATNLPPRRFRSRRNVRRDSRGCWVRTIGEFGRKLAGNIAQQERRIWGKLCHTGAPALLRKEAQQWVVSYL